MKNRYKPIFCALLILFASKASVPAQTEPELHIGTVHLPPWGFFDEKGQAVGILYEIANTIAEDLGMPYRNQVLPAARLLRDLDKNLIDFTIIYRTPNSERIGVPIAKVYSGIQNIVIGRSGLDIRNAFELYRHTIAVPRGGKFGEPFDSDPHLKRISSHEYKQSIRFLARSRVDTVVGSRQTLFYCAAQQGLTLDFFGHPYLLTVTEEWVHVPRTTGSRVDPARVKATLDRLRRAGDLDKLEQKYLPPMYFRTQVQPEAPWPSPAAPERIKQ